MSATRIGIALGRDWLTAVELRQTWRGVRPGRVFTWQLPAMREEAGPAALLAALGELRAEIGGSRVSASIALLRPLAQAKVIAVPPVGRNELEPLVHRNVRRYFIIEGDDVHVAARPTGARRAGSDKETRVLAVAAPAYAITTILAVAESANVDVERITAAPVALREAILAFAPGARRGRVLAVGSADGWQEAMLLQDGAMRLVQPLAASRPEETDALWRGVTSSIDACTGCGCRPQSAVVLGDAAAVDAVFERLGSAEEPVTRLALRPEADGLSPNVLLAFGAALAGERAPLVLTDSLRQGRARHAGRRTLALASCAAVMVATGAALHTAKLGRELQSVEARRHAMSSSVRSAMADRQAVDRARATLAVLAHAEGDTPRWTGVLAALAQALPKSAYLVSLSTSGDKLQLTGAAASAQAVVPSLEASRALSDVMFTTAPRGGNGGLEHFELSASVHTTDATADRPTELP